ncbi:MAG TPA: methyltransferase domain-containing protein [Terriglobales bacterium]|nr:methyltransferase domain-containing protein [Terriglobales bacterium]
MAGSDYALGYTNAEHDRLIRQAVRIAPATERVFRASGIRRGDRVLELGSGVGDVAMLVAQLVGPSGEVVGVERDPDSIAKATARVTEAGLRNVTFVQNDVHKINSGDKLFDAVVGRFILMFLPDPLAMLRETLHLVRPGGVVAFQEPSWTPLLALGSRYPLWSKLLQSIHQVFLCSGVNPEMGLDLYRVFQEAGLPAPSMNMEVPLGCDPEFTGLLAGLITSVRPLAEQHKIDLGNLGDLSTLASRIHREIADAHSVVCFVPLVGVWSRKPESDGHTTG